jgi:glycyl-tRNA synthetase alpha subunit
MQRLESLTALPAQTNFGLAELEQHFAVIDRRLTQIKRQLKAGVAKSAYEKLVKTEYALQLAHKNLTILTKLMKQRGRA